MLDLHLARSLMIGSQAALGAARTTLVGAYANHKQLYHDSGSHHQRSMFSKASPGRQLCLGSSGASSGIRTFPSPGFLLHRRRPTLRTTPSAGTGAAAVWPSDSSDDSSSSDQGTKKGPFQGLFSFFHSSSAQDGASSTTAGSAAGGSPSRSAQLTASMSAAEKEQMKRELHSLNVAISVNVVIMLAKIWVHVISGSSAMLAEALHSLADALNQLLLRIGVLKAMKAPTPSHQYGYMRDRFVFSLISAVGIFFLGAGASVLHGIHMLGEARHMEAEMWSYLVLGLSGLLEGYSLWVATRHVVTSARARGISPWAYIKAGSDPTTVAVMMEDGGAVAGLAIAGACTAAAHITGNAMWDAVGSILVGGLLGLIAVFLVQKNRDLLLGRSMSATDTEAVMSHLRKDPVVAYVTDTKTEEIGPGVFRFKAEVAWDGDRLVERYLARCGRQRLAQALARALKEEEEQAAALNAQATATQQHAGVAASGSTSGGEAGSSSSSGTQQQQPAWKQQPGGLPGGPLDRVLKGYGRDIISAVGAEVDRIEAEIQVINPGIRWVDLETDRGRWGGAVSSAAGVGPNAGPTNNASNTSSNTSSNSSGAGSMYTTGIPTTTSSSSRHRAAGGPDATMQIAAQGIHEVQAARVLGVPPAFAPDASAVHQPVASHSSSAQQQQQGQQQWSEGVWIDGKLVEGSGSQWEMTPHSPSATASQNLEHGSGGSSANGSLGELGSPGSLPHYQCSVACSADDALGSASQSSSTTSSSSTDAH